jgi:hypothetical protein
MHMSGKRNWADLMGKGLAYVVLRKGNRVQVLVGPTDKQLRRRGRRGWRVIASGGDPGPFEVTDGLREAVLDGLAQLARERQAGRSAGRKKTRKRDGQGANGELAVKAAG